MYSSTIEPDAVVVYYSESEENRSGFHAALKSVCEVHLCGALSEVQDLLKTKKTDVIVVDEQLYLLHEERSQDFDGCTFVVLHSSLDKKWEDKNIYFLPGMGFELLIAPIQAIIESHWLMKRNNELEKALLEKEENANAVFDTLVNIFVSVDLQGIIQAISPSVEKVLGYTQQEVIGLPVILFYASPEDREILLERIRTDGYFSDFRTRIVAKDGHLVPVMANSKIRLDSNGNPVRIDSLFRDIGEQEVAEHDLEESRRLIDHVQKLAHLGTWTWNILQDKVEWSQELYHIYGLDHLTFGASFQGYLERVHDEDKERVMKIIQGVLQTKGEFKFEERILRPGGEVRHLKTWGAVTTNEKGVPIKMYGICLDVTESKLQDQELIESREQLRDINSHLEKLVQKRTQELELAKSDLEVAFEKEKELNELRSRFVSDASHQFRTPLTVIKSNVSLIEMFLKKLPINNSGRMTNYISRIQYEVDRMTTLMNDILVLGKIESGGIRLNKSFTNIFALCKRIIEEFTEIQSDKRTVELSCSGDIREVYIDAKLIEEVISNLLSNAFKYSEGRPNPEIHIDFTKSPVQLMVRDYGIGIPKSELSKMFVPFYRASNVGEIPGTGLGSSIIKQYVELNDGEIEVFSELNKGTEVTISFE